MKIPETVKVLHQEYNSYALIMLRGADIYQISVFGETVIQNESNSTTTLVKVRLVSLMIPLKCQTISEEHSVGD